MRAIAGHALSKANLTYPRRESQHEHDMDSSGPFSEIFPSLQDVYLVHDPFYRLQQSEGHSTSAHGLPSVDRNVSAPPREPVFEFPLFQHPDDHEQSLSDLDVATFAHPQALSRRALVNLVVEKDLSPSAFVNLLSQQENLHTVDLSRLSEMEDLTGWSPYFLTSVRSLIAFPSEFDIPSYDSSLPHPSSYYKSSADKGNSLDRSATPSSDEQIAAAPASSASGQPAVSSCASRAQSSDGPGPPDPDLEPYHTATFPSGRDNEDFIPFGDVRVASIEQGNIWPIDVALRDQILLAEMDVLKLRGTRLTSHQVLEKYSTWKGAATTLRGRVRQLLLPPEQRRRFGARHLQALRDAMPLCTDSIGNISWKRVREVVIEETGRPFEESELRKQWEATL